MQGFESASNHALSFNSPLNEEEKLRAIAFVQNHYGPNLQVHDIPNLLRRHESQLIEIGLNLQQVIDFMEEVFNFDPASEEKEITTDINAEDKHVKVENDEERQIIDAGEHEWNKTDKVAALDSKDRPESKIKEAESIIDEKETTNRGTQHDNEASSETDVTSEPGEPEMETRRSSRISKTTPKIEASKETSPTKRPRRTSRRLME